MSDQIAPMDRRVSDQIAHLPRRKNTVLTKKNIVLNQENNDLIALTMEISDIGSKHAINYMDTHQAIPMQEQTQTQIRIKGFYAANQVSEVSHSDEGRLAVSLLDVQLKQLLSLLNNQNEGPGSKTNAVSQGCLKLILMIELLIAEQHIILMYNLDFCIKTNNAHYHPYCC